jgi:hypothetical protein
MGGGGDTCAGMKHQASPVRSALAWITPVLFALGCMTNDLALDPEGSEPLVDEDTAYATSPPPMNFNELEWNGSWVNLNGQWGLRTSNNPTNSDHNCVHSADNALMAWALAWGRPAYAEYWRHAESLRNTLMAMQWGYPQIRRGWLVTPGDPGLCTNQTLPGVPFQPLHGVVEVSATFGAGPSVRQFIESHLDFQARRLGDAASDDVAFHMMSAATATSVDRAPQNRARALAAWRELRRRLVGGIRVFPTRPQLVNTLRHTQIVYAMKRTSQLLGNLDGDLVGRTNTLYNQMSHNDASGLSNGTDSCDTEQCYGYYLLASDSLTDRVNRVIRQHKLNRCAGSGMNGGWRYRNRSSLACTGFGSLEASALGYLADQKIWNQWNSLFW